MIFSEIDKVPCHVANETRGFICKDKVVGIYLNSLLL